MLNFIEIIRGIGILAVILVHTTAIGVSTENDFIRYLNIVLGQFSGFAVPIFIMVSGYVLSISNFGNLNTKKQIKFFYIKRIKKILIPYAFFSSIFIILHIPFGHFWFFNLILYLYFLYPILNLKILNPIITLVCLIFCAYSLEYFLYFSGLSINPIFHPKYILYMWMGILLYRNEKIIYKWIEKYSFFLMFIYIVILIIQTTWTFLYSNNYLYIEIWATLSLTSISIILFLIFYFVAKGYIPLRFQEKLSFFGELSFGIYIIHIVFLGVTKLLLLQVTTKDNILVYMVVFIVSLIGSIIFTQILREFKLGRYVLSMQASIRGKNN